MCEGYWVYCPRCQHHMPTITRYCKPCGTVKGLYGDADEDELCENCLVEAKENKEVIHVQLEKPPRRATPRIDRPAAQRWRSNPDIELLRRVGATPDIAKQADGAVVQRPTGDNVTWWPAGREKFDLPADREELQWPADQSRDKSSVPSAFERPSSPKAHRAIDADGSDCESEASVCRSEHPRTPQSKEQEPNESPKERTWSMEQVRGMVDELLYPHDHTSRFQESIDPQDEEIQTDESEDERRNILRRRGSPAGKRRRGR